MSVKQPRQAIVSIRLSDDEQERLRKIADANGSSVSDVVRGFVHREMADPLPEGRSTAARRPAGLNEGVFWTTTGGGVTAQGWTLTIHPIED